MSRDLLSVDEFINEVRDRSNVMESEGISNLSLSLASRLLLCSSVSSSSSGLLNVKM